MIELLLILGGAFGAGMGGMWIKTRRRTNKGKAAAAVERFDDAARVVSAAQARWFDLQIEAGIVAGGVTGDAKVAVEGAEAKANSSSRRLYDAWLPVSDVNTDDIASFSDESRREVAGYKRKALSVAEEFERDLDALEQVLDEHRR